MHNIPSEPSRQGLHGDLTCGITIIYWAVCGRPPYRSFCAICAEYNLSREEIFRLTRYFRDIPVCIGLRPIVSQRSSPVAERCSVKETGRARPCATYT